MPQFKYNIQTLSVEDIRRGTGISAQDKSLLTEYQVNAPFEPFQNSIELHIYSLDGSLIQSEYKYNSKVNFGPVDQNSKTPRIDLNPKEDAVSRGYEYGDVRLVYHFIDDAFTSDQTTADFYIEEISTDRTEVRLLTTRFDNQTIQDRITSLKSKIESTPNFTDLRLNFGDDRLLLVTNVATQDYNGNTSIVVKLYESLPTDIVLKQQTYLQELVADSIGFQVDAEVIPDEIVIPYIKGPNFGAALDNQSTAPSEYLSYDELYSDVANNTNIQYQTLLKEKGVELSVDYSDYANFINFSSAVERLENFKYKLDLINSYQNSLDSANNSNNPNSGSKDYFQSLLNGVISGFDHYDRFLYFESSSYSWPKQNSEVPYLNATGSATGSWYTLQYESASLYDNSNPHRLLNTIPGFISDDTRNQPYITFVEMISQHFDNIWLYSKAVTDKYDADNRVNHGISKDLVEEALRNFGVKLYNSNKNTEDLFKMFTSGFYQTGSEDINTFISASDIPTSEDNYRKEIYKRLYHNLPLLTKAKGTERGLRALINSFGIPTLYSSGSHSGLKIRTSGGGYLGDNVYLGPSRLTVSSLEDMTIYDSTTKLTGSTLSQYTSIIERDSYQAPDTHTVHIGFSPTDSVDAFIETALTASGFNIDDIIGDPSLEFTDRYTELFTSASQILTNNERYDLQDFTRLLKFYDNVFFKTVKDFVPARSNVTTGVIIKPHILERSKAKQVQASTQQNYGNSTTVGLFEDSILLTSSIDVETYEGSHGESYPQDYSTAYTASIITPDGTVNKIIDSEEAKFNGELSGSILEVLNADPKQIVEKTVDITGRYIGVDGPDSTWVKSTANSISVHASSLLKSIYLQAEDLESQDLHNDIASAQEVSLNGGPFIEVSGSTIYNDTLKYWRIKLDSATTETLLGQVNTLRIKYTTPIYNLPDPIEGNAIDGKKSSYIQDVNRTTAETSPNNLSLILSDNRENLADVADWRYSSIGYGNGRYYGSKTSKKEYDKYGTVPAVGAQYFTGELFPISSSLTDNLIISKSNQDRNYEQLSFYREPKARTLNSRTLDYPQTYYVPVRKPKSPKPFPWLWNTFNIYWNSVNRAFQTQNDKSITDQIEVGDVLHIESSSAPTSGALYVRVEAVYDVNLYETQVVFTYEDQDLTDIYTQTPFDTGSSSNSEVLLTVIKGDVVIQPSEDTNVYAAIPRKRIYVQESNSIIKTDKFGAVLG
mgnify:CR=1 FL=1